MLKRTLVGVAWCVLALWAVAALTADRARVNALPPFMSYAPEMAIIPVDCGPQPSWQFREEWYAYGDCSGDYGPIDQAE